MKKIIKLICNGRWNNKEKTQKGFANIDSLEKGSSYIERYREIVSDPLNILIKRDPRAGYVDQRGRVLLHNGNRVPIDGKWAYYPPFSDILIINRGVHEPLEEYCFQQVLKKLRQKNPISIELGAYWSHYSMWLVKEFPNAKCYMVEPDQKNLECGKNNFMINNYIGEHEFINDIVGPSGFNVDNFIRERKLSSISILHSDIQGYELEMIEGAHLALNEKLIDYLFISTHNQTLHTLIVDKLNHYDYRVEVSSDYISHTTGHDGFILASSKDLGPVFRSFSPLGREEIMQASPERLIDSLVKASKNF